MLITMNTYHYRINEACVVLCGCQKYDTAISNITRLWLFLREILRAYMDIILLKHFPIHAVKYLQYHTLPLAQA